MTGCFSNVDREDRAMEADLFRFLASQQESDAVEAVASDMMQKAASPEYAGRLFFDFEMMLERVPEIIAAACEAKKTADSTPQFSSRAWTYEQLGRSVVQMIEQEATRIATFQENCDA